MNISVSEYRNSTLLAEYPILLTFSVLDCNADTSIVIPVDTNATSIDDMYSDTYIALYPNPASDAVSIQYGGTEQQAYLYDIKGMKLQEVELSNGQAQLKQRLRIAGRIGRHQIALHRVRGFQSGNRVHQHREEHHHHHHGRL